MNTSISSRIFFRKAMGAICTVAFLLVWAAALPQPCALGQTHHRHHAAAKLDINTATLAQLQAVHGLGPVYAKRIVAGRPYTSKRQLKTRGILPDNLYMQVKDHLIAHRPKKKP